VIVRGVGQANAPDAEDEEPLALVRSADFERLEQSSLNLEAHAK
jgi:hypothetical protein